MDSFDCLRLDLIAHFPNVFIDGFLRIRTTRSLQSPHAAVQSKPCFLPVHRFESQPVLQLNRNEHMMSSVAVGLSVFTGSSLWFTISHSHSSRSKCSTSPLHSGRIVEFLCRKTSRPSLGSLLYMRIRESSQALTMSFFFCISLYEEIGYFREFTTLDLAQGNNLPNAMYLICCVAAKYKQQPRTDRWTKRLLWSSDVPQLGALFWLWPEIQNTNIEDLITV